MRIRDNLHLYGYAKMVENNLEENDDTCCL